jgi:hypothetical protein
MYWSYVFVFVAGIFTGLFVGYVVLAFCHAAAEGDEMAGYDDR